MHYSFREKNTTKHSIPVKITFWDFHSPFSVASFAFQWPLSFDLPSLILTGLFYSYSSVKYRFMWSLKDRKKILLEAIVGYSDFIEALALSKLKISG